MRHDIGVYPYICEVYTVNGHNTIIVYENQNQNGDLFQDGRRYIIYIVLTKYDLTRNSPLFLYISDQHIP
jgi:hypothetical protein